MSDLSHQINEAGKLWSELNGDAQLLEEMKHSVRAEIGNQANESSAAAKEQYALRQGEYTDHIKRMVEARTAANIAKARWEALKIESDWRRTRESTKRAEMQLL